MGNEAEVEAARQKVRALKAVKAPRQEVIAAIDHLKSLVDPPGSCHVLWCPCALAQSQMPPCYASVNG